MHPAPEAQQPFPDSRKYQASLAAELRVYEDCLDVHSLPAIFHYWSNRHLLPSLQAMGASAPSDLFVQNLSAQFDADSRTLRRFVSLGSGNCDLEVSIAGELCRRGYRNFVFDCVDLNEAMLRRGAASARDAGLAGHVNFVQGDLNAWTPRAEYDAVIANQSLHHVVNLENLFGEVKRSLRPGGRFVISDIIGRNGHLRWPEALEIVREFWRKLPPSYRWNRRSCCYEELFADHDCSGEGFEGVRSQDILPLLLDRFHFRFFFPFGNVIDPFIDRSFGPNFDPARECDRAFIGRIHRVDQLQIASGRISPTHMMAVVNGDSAASCVFPGNLSPTFCIRPNDRKARISASPAAVYQWQWEQHHGEAWPNTPGAELEKTCAMLTDSAGMIERQTAWALSLERDARERLEWGLDLERQVENIEHLLDERTDWARSLEREVQARTHWAFELRKEVDERAALTATLEARAAGLTAEIEDRTAWAHRLEAQLSERTRWALSLQTDLIRQTRRADRLAREIRSYLRNPLRLLLRMAAAIGNRLLRSHRQPADELHG